MNRSCGGLAAERQSVGHPGPLVAVMGFWRRREPGCRRRCDVADDDRGSSCDQLCGDDRGDAISCRGLGQPGFDAGIDPRAADFADQIPGMRGAGARTPDRATISRPRQTPSVPGQKACGGENPSRCRWLVQAQCGGLDVQHAVADDKGRPALGRSSASRGRAAHKMTEGRRAAPAVVLSTIT